MKGFTDSANETKSSSYGHAIVTSVDSKCVTLLFVDDSVTDRTRGVGLIRKHHPDWHVIPAFDGQEALYVLGNGNVDIVVSDLFMPGLDGRQLLQVINSKYPLTPVVLITAQGNDQIAAECVALGAANYVPKRRLAADLINVIDDVLLAEKESAEMRRVLQHVVQNQCAFEIESDLEQIRSLISFVQKRLDAYHVLTPQQVQNLTTAVREALLNAFYHGNLEVNSHPLELCRSDYIAVAAERQNNAAFAERRIRLSVSLEQESIRLHISDDGPGFDQSCLVELTGETRPDALNGNGIRQMQMFATNVEYNDTGNEVTLTLELESNVETDTSGD